MESPSQAGRSGKRTLPSPSFRAVAACFMALLPKIATATMSREISLVVGNTGFPSEFRSCNTVIVIFLGDLSTLSHILFFTVTVTTALTSARDDGIGMESPSRLRYSVKCPFPPQVISSGGSMLYRSTVKNRYSFEESRNLSCGREYTL